VCKKGILNQILLITQTTTLLQYASMPKVAVYLQANDEANDEGGK